MTTTGVTAFTPDRTAMALDLSAWGASGTAYDLTRPDPPAIRA